MIEKQMPDSFRYFRTFFEAAAMLEDDARLKFYDAMNEYVFVGTQPSFLGDTSAEGKMLKMAWLLVNPVIDKSIRNSNGGRNSGGERPSMEGNDNARKQHENNSYSTPIQLQNNRDKDKDKDKEESIKKNRTAFESPSIDEVREYADNSGYAINAEAFVSYYESVGWMVGKNKMKNWQAAVRNWASREKQPNPQPQQRKTKVVNLDDVL